MLGSEAPHLSDGSVALRAWTGDDVPVLVECLNGDEEIARWLDQVPQPYTEADARAYLSRDVEETFAITEGGRVLGSIGLRWDEPRDVAEVGYWLRADARGRGATTRALRLVTAHAFASGAARVQLRADVENAASRRVAEKAGFRLEGVLRSARFNARLGRRTDWAMYSLLPDELS